MLFCLYSTLWLVLDNRKGGLSIFQRIRDDRLACGSKSTNAETQLVEPAGKFLSFFMAETEPTYPPPGQIRNGCSGGLFLSKPDKQPCGVR